MRNKSITIFISVLIFYVTQPLSARVIRLENVKKYDVYNGQPFGNIGVYEWMAGDIVFQLDPNHIQNKKICDIEYAIKNKDGLVEFKTSFIVLHPKDPTKGNSTALVEISNRGGINLLRMYNGATTGQVRPNVPKDFGSEFLLKQGFTLIWIAWQWDVPPGNNRLHLNLFPITYDSGQEITGLVRADWVVDNDTTKILSLGHRNMLAYPVSNPHSSIHILTYRNTIDETKIEVPRTEWDFIDSTHISRSAGFKKGVIYELVYKAKNPVIAGLGLLAIRDMASYMKYDSTCIFPVKKCLAQGVSQTGRLLRQFLFDGLNQDENDRFVYDGMMIYMAGAGRGSFNHRFAQPSRDGHRFSSFDYPVDIEPFHIDQFKENAHHHMKGQMHSNDPIKIFSINTGYEYWGRGASLIHTTIQGQDLLISPNERYFHIASAQHYTEPMPDSSGLIYDKYLVFKGNPLLPAPYFKALLVQMKGWLIENKSPSENLIPNFKNGTLVDAKKYKLPYIPGLDLPIAPYTPTELYFGHRWYTHKIIDQEPPIKSDFYHIYIPAVDSFGNEKSGIRSIELRVPLATYIPWSLRYNLPNAREMDDFRGLFIPLPPVSTNTTASDKRPALSKLYKNKEEYLYKIDRELANLVAERLLLAEDIPDLKDRSIRLWETIAKFYK